MLLKKCKLCENEFESKCWNAIFCSSVCKSRFHSKQYYRNHRDRCLEHKKRFYKKNKKTIIIRNSQYCTQRRKIDLEYRLRRYLRSRLYNAINKQYRVGSAVDNLGCSISFLKKYLESQFDTNMSWDNYGKWHIDHVIPLAAFNLKDLIELKKACHYSNLQPLWAKDNLSKGNKHDR